ncbi:HET-domain-containing protein [Trametes sanguinea]|nr:HET-domain-containing protein [Trametes sanguinea]
MWLLDTQDGTFRHIDRPREHRYAILSHCWQATGEQSYQDLVAIQASAKKKRSWLGRYTPLTRNASGSVLTKASAKVRECCELARKHGYRSLWIDSCCIDKTSSTELSEAINTMYEWYAAADMCFAYLEDVSDDHDPRLKDSKFRRSRWFTRGWTLQELIAPAVVMFFSKEWRPLGTKASLADLVEEITGIDRAVLTHEKPLDSASVARRMSWAAKRQTTREEDKAYSLMGIFGVNMPTIYGEGGNAFVRLQEEILKHVPDQSIFAWGPVLRDDAVLYRNLGPHSVNDDSRYWQSRNLFAWSPDAFVNCADVSSIPLADFQKRVGIALVFSGYAITSQGMRAQLPVIPIHHSSTKTTYLALLGCEDAQRRLIALLLFPQPDAMGRFYVGHYVGRPQVPPNSYFRAVTLSEPHLESIAQAVEVMEVCVPYRPTLVAQRSPLRMPSSPSFTCPCDVVVPTWQIANLAEAGFFTSTDGDDNTAHITEFSPPHTVALVLTSTGETIQIRMGRCQCRGRLLCASVTGSNVHAKRPLRTILEPLAGDTPRSRVTSDRAPQGFAARCPADHVAAWENGSKEFGHGSRRVRLTFTMWMTRADMYSLDVEIGAQEPSDEDER